MNSTNGMGSLGARCFAALGLMLALAACQHAEPDYTGSIPFDYRDRHPIRLVDGQRTLQILVGAGRSGLTPTQRAQVASLGSDWRREGTGRVIIEIPAGSQNTLSAKQTVREIRSLLQFGGVPSQATFIRNYEQPYGSDLGAIRVTYTKIMAQVEACDASNSAIGPGLITDPEYLKQNVANKPFWNFGCATQQNLAASVANPEDLIQPRAETPAYATRRSTVMDKYGKGTDPTSVYSAVQSTGKASSTTP